MFTRFSYKYLKDVKYDRDIVNLLCQIHEYKGRQNVLISLKNKALDRMKFSAFIDNTVSSCELAGFTLKPTRYKELIIDGNKAETIEEKEVVGYKKAQQYIYKKYKEIPVDEDTLKTLHKYIFSYQRNYKGKYKNENNYVYKFNDKDEKELVFATVSKEDVSDAINNLFNEYNQMLNEYKIDALLLIPIFAIDFLCIAPFSKGNMRLMNILMNFLLFKSDYLIGKYVSLEKLVLDSKDDFYKTLKESVINWHTRQNEEITFTIYILNIILKAYQEFEKMIDVPNEKKLFSKALVLKTIENFEGNFTKAQVLYMCPQLRRASIENALTNLVQAKKIKRCGGGRSTYYCKVTN